MDFFLLIDSYKTAGLCKTTLPTKVKKEETTKVRSIRVHKCEICGFVVKTAPYLVAHMLSLHSNDRPFSCTQCSSAFNTTTNLNKHVRRIHDQLRNAQCPLCIKSKYQKYNFLIVMFEYYL